MNFKCPIFTSDEIIEKAGIVLDFEKGTGVELPGEDEVPEEVIETPEVLEKRTKIPGLVSSSMEELKSLLAEAVANEDYERASEIRDEINRRSK